MPWVLVATLALVSVGCGSAWAEDPVPASLARLMVLAERTDDASRRLRESAMRELAPHVANYPEIERLFFRLARRLETVSVAWEALSEYAPDSPALRNELVRAATLTGDSRPKLPARGLERLRAWIDEDPRMRRVLIAALRADSAYSAEYVLSASRNPEVLAALLDRHLELGRGPGGDTWGMLVRRVETDPIWRDRVAEIATDSRAPWQPWQRATWRRRRSLAIDLLYRARAGVSTELVRSINGVFVRLSTDPDEKVRYSAVYNLLYGQDGEVPSALYALASDPSERIRVWLAWRARQIARAADAGDAEAAQAWDVLQADRSPDVRNAMTRSLEDTPLGERSFRWIEYHRSENPARMVRKWGPNWESHPDVVASAEWMRARGGAVVPRDVLTGAREGTTDARLTAISALAERCGRFPEALSELVTLTADSDPRIRRAAAGALLPEFVRNAGARRAVLRQMLRDRTPWEQVDEFASAFVSGPEGRQAAQDLWQALHEIPMKNGRILPVVDEGLQALARYARVDPEFRLQMLRYAAGVLPFRVRALTLSRTRWPALAARVVNGAYSDQGRGEFVSGESGLNVAEGGYRGGTTATESAAIEAFLAERLNLLQTRPGAVTTQEVERIRAIRAFHAARAGQPCPTLEEILRGGL